MRGGGFTFSQVPYADIPRSKFNRSHGHKTTFNAGYLIPIYVDEALPGDTFKVNASVFARLATPVVPFMDNLHMDVFFFAVPNRLVWDNWQKFMGERLDPEDSIDFLIPQIQADAVGFPHLSIFDYMGLPLLVPGIQVSALWARAYNLIWNEWFRDENLQDREVVHRDDGPDPQASYNLLRRGKRHDYFTSALPWPQKGPGVELPLGSIAPVISNQNQITMRDVGNNQGSVLMSGGALTVTNIPGNSGMKFGSESGLVADLSEATAGTINSLREAFQIQKLLERDARGGTRYVEILRSHFGVVSPDARLQRPEFLGGGTIPVIVNPVTQTAPTGIGDTPQGNLAAYGLASGRAGFSKSFVEHTLLLGLAMVRADLSYQQGIPKMFSRRTRYDFYWPAFAHLGEQAVLSKEIYCDGTPDDESVFGYQERWAEYRYFPSKITGKLRSGFGADSLDFWHLAQYFATRPVLGSSFIRENPPIDRVVAVTDEPQFVFDSHFRIECVRPMPTYSVPGYIDHF